MRTQPGSPATPEQTKRFLLILWVVLFVVIGLYWYVLQMIQPSIRDVTSVGNVILGLAIAMAGVVLYLRLVRIGSILSLATPASAKDLGTLQKHYILCYSLSLSVALDGFVLRFMGATNYQAAPFFIGAVALFLVCYPRLPDTFDPHKLSNNNP